MAKAITRLYVQFVWADGSYARWQSRRNLPLGRIEMAEALEKIATNLRADVDVTPRTPHREE